MSHQTRIDHFLLNKKKIISLFAVLLFSASLFSSTSIAQKELRYIKGLGAVLRADSSIQSKTLTKLIRGTRVILLETKGIWQKVKAGDNQGWLMRGLLTNQPINLKKSVLGQKISLNASSGRRLRLRTFSAVIGVKGLVDSKGKKISPYQTDYQALEWLEKQPADEEVSVQYLTFSE